MSRSVTQYRVGVSPSARRAFNGVFACPILCLPAIPATCDVLLCQPVQAVDASYFAVIHRKSPHAV